MFMRCMWMAVLVLVTGCDGIELDRLVEQHPPLTRLVPEPVGANCAHGGHFVRTGLDRNDNGVLDDDEVTRTEYACVTSVPGVLVRVQDEPPGENCTQGGKVYRAGQDTNGNAELEDSEVSRQVYGCASSEAVVTRVRAREPFVFPCGESGAVVEAGQDPNGNGVLDDSEVRATSTLCVLPSEVRLRQSPAPAGDACPTPSTRVDVGTDADADGLFEDEEVMSSLFVCQPLHTLDGNYFVRNAVDLVALEGISRVRGNLSFDAGSATAAVLPDLMQVEGALEIFDTSLERLELPSLRLVGGPLTAARNPALTTLTLGSGSRAPLWVWGEFSLVSNPLLPTLVGVSAVLPSSSILLRDNAALEEGSFTFVSRHLGSITLEGNAKLSTLPFRNLEWVGGSLNIIGNSSLSNLSGTVLQQVVGDLVIGDNPILTSLSGMPALTSIGGGLRVRDNANLRSVEGLNELTQVGTLEFERNPTLEAAGEFPKLARVTSGMRFNDNAVLKDLWGLERVQNSGFLFIGNNPRLFRLMGFDRLLSLKVLTLENNASLTDLSDLILLQSVEELYVLSNENLLRLDLNALESVTHIFTVTENPRLPTCLAVSLAARVNMGGAPEIRGNDSSASCD
ncbi:leucine-rich repeat domain-containing protein [Myxococcus sp. AM001]|nr:leucine-rich repeat domain-containing protein [Myxococcus sp. AM001]